MPELQDTLTMLAERGDPIGPDAMVTRVDAVLAERQSARSGVSLWSADGQGVGVLRAGVSLLVVLVVGVTIALLVGRDVAPIDEDPDIPPTTIEGAPSTVVDMTDWVAPVGTTYDPVEIPGLSESLGPFVWTLVESDGFGEFPLSGVHFDPVLGYVSDDGATGWTSQDGYVWESSQPEDLAWFEEEFDSFELMGDYARVVVASDNGVGVEELLRRDGSKWVPVELPGPASLDGLVVTTSYDLIRASGESLLVTLEDTGSIPWSSVVDGYLGPAFDLWQEGRLGIEVESGTIPLAVEHDGSTIRFVNEDTGEAVHSAQMPSGEAAARWAADPMCFNDRGCTLGTAAWISVDGGAFSRTELPGGGHELVGLGGGGFAYVEPNTGQVLVTNDGDWSPTGFAFGGLAACGGESGTDHLNLDAHEAGFIVTFACAGSEGETWGSGDGINWFRDSLPTRQPVWGAVRAVDDGGVDGQPPKGPDPHMALEVSTDGAETWVPLPERPGALVLEAGEIEFLADGELVFVFQWRDDDPHAWMWVGRFLGG